MTLSQLKCFIDLAEMLSFSKVAIHNYIAQTAVSYQIKSLEDELGIKLFSRTTRQVRLTDAGRTYYNEVVPAVNRLEHARQSLINHEIDPGITIGYSYLCGGQTLSESIKMFQGKFPKVRIMLIHEEPESGLLELLSSGKIDVAFFLTSIPEPPSGISAITLGRCPGVLMYTPDYPFEVKIPENIAELINEILITFDDLDKSRNFIPEDTEHRKHNHMVQRQIITKDILSMLEMTQAGLGIAVMPLVDEDRVSVLAHRRMELAPLDPYAVIFWQTLNQNEYIQEFAQIVQDLLAPRLAQFTDASS
jgi:DNA-binding transcriptional LysR family regulator